jgi:hypothetical protein
MDALPIADLTATATVILAGITLALAIATVALVVVTRQGTAQARSAAKAELNVLERQVGTGYRPLLVDVIRTAPVPPDVGALYDVSRSDGPNRIADYPGPVIETKFPGHEPALFDPRMAFVSFEAGKIYLSVPLRNVGRGLAVIDGGGVALTGPFVGALEYRTIQRYHVPVAETTRVDLITGYLRQQASELVEQGHTLLGISWKLTVPYCDFAGEQRTVARLQIVCRGDRVEGPWLVDRVEQETPGDQEPHGDELRDADSSPRTDAPGERIDVTRQTVTDLWGNPRRPKRRNR